MSTGRLARLLPPAGPVRAMAVGSLVTTVGSGLYLAGSMLFFTRVIGLGVPVVGAGLAVATVVGVVSGIPLGHVADRVGPRNLFIALQLVQATAMFAFPLVHTFGTFLVLVTLAAIGQRGGMAVSGALIARISEPSHRTRERGYLRAVVNLGIGVGVALAGIALQVNSDFAYTVLIVGNGLTFVVAALVLLAIPRLPPLPVPAGARRFEAVRDRQYFALALVCGIIAFQYDVIALVLPLWLVTETAAPRWWLSVLLVFNTAVIVLFQVRATRRVTDVASGASALRRAGLLFLVGSVMLASAAGLPALVAAGLLLAGVVIQSWGELGLAAGACEIGYGLAPEHAQGQYQGAFNLAAGVTRSVSPIVLSTLCLTWGRPGWLVLGALFAAAGLAVGPLARWALRSRPAYQTQLNVSTA